ncbi:hypothetical protein T492DRAFT_247932 [Pavlovales sp. CCMP2436]|nr:hypothetical protein T492DRAFT_247932 [Pavlovales sp. CCMP2436]
MGRMWQQVVQHWRRAEAVAAPPTTLPPSLLDSLPPPALLAISLLATVLVMYIASKFRAFEVKMRSEGCSPTAIAAFKYNYGVLVSGADLMIGEAAIKPIEKLPTLDELDPAEEPALLECTVSSRSIPLPTPTYPLSYCIPWYAFFFIVVLLTPPDLQPEGVQA